MKFAFSLLLALALGACATTGQLPLQEASPLPEPPPWNSIEMIWLDTEVVLLDSVSEALELLSA